MGPTATGKPEREHPGLQGNALLRGLTLPSRSLVGQDKWPQSPELPSALLEPRPTLHVFLADIQLTVHPEGHRRS